MTKRLAWLIVLSSWALLAAYGLAWSRVPSAPAVVGPGLDVGQVFEPWAVRCVSMPEGLGCGK